MPFADSQPQPGLLPAPKPLYAGLGREEEAQALFEQTLTKEKARHNVEILRKAREQQAKPPAEQG